MQGEQNALFGSLSPGEHVKSISQCDQAEHVAKRRAVKRMGQALWAFFFFFLFEWFPIRVVSRYFFLNLMSQKQLVTVISAYPMLWPLLCQLSGSKVSGSIMKLAPVSP